MTTDLMSILKVTRRVSFFRMPPVSTSQWLENNASGKSSRCSFFAMNVEGETSVQVDTQNLEISFWSERFNAERY